MSTSREKGRIIIFNGVGSSGKTSIARALQAIAKVPLLHVQMDTFIDMLPENMFADPQGMVFETIEEDGKPSVRITSGPVANRAMAGMWQAVAALAASGNDLIFDVVMFAEDRAHCAGLAQRFDVKIVGVHAPLEILEARERSRGDRQAGLSRWQYSRVHEGMTYDLELDTRKLSPGQCAEMIRAALDL